jgi:hypothetical protein
MKYEYFNSNGFKENYLKKKRMNPDFISFKVENKDLE